jgi:hypothetical protein
MRRIFIVAALALGLNGCTAAGPDLGDLLPSAPVDLAQHTPADEQARLRCEQSYKLSRSIGEIAVDAGLVRGQLATQLAGLDNSLYNGLQACRTAYRAFNSTSLISAADELDRLAGQIAALIRGRQN